MIMICFLNTEPTLAADSEVNDIIELCVLLIELCLSWWHLQELPLLGGELDGPTRPNRFCLQRLASQRPHSSRKK